ncbi:hypothetical protein [Calycomorphotria hydatis]|uniref:DUF4304 domain-containing protein n=1 Tax=Calycomorphotria hydatis TaxID=2528027 RepID=A0A517T8J2_9PLAN|nr:hypothetical protein [Calycomorphotria hydatis]QDT64700.1 hypothetical protein V22_19410 [Calycomorphotria hydatis]
MSKRENERLIHDRLAFQLGSYGFLADSELLYYRETENCLNIINVGVRDLGGETRVTCTLGIRFEQIENLIRPTEKDRTLSTVFNPIHLLREDREYFEWSGSNEDQLNKAVDSMVEEICEIGLPFFEKFSNLAIVEDELESNRVSDYFALAPIQHVSVLAAIYVLKNEQEKAIALFDDALQEKFNQNPGKKRRFLSVMEQLGLTPAQ